MLKMFVNYHTVDVDVFLINQLKFYDYKSIMLINKYVYELCHHHIILKHKMKNVNEYVNKIVNILDNQLYQKGLYFNVKPGFVFNDLEKYYIYEGQSKFFYQFDNFKNTKLNHIIFDKPDINLYDDKTKKKKLMMPYNFNCIGFNFTISKGLLVTILKFLFFNDMILIL